MKDYFKLLGKKFNPKTFWKKCVCLGKSIMVYTYSSRLIGHLFCPLWYYPRIWIFKCLNQIESCPLPYRIGLYVFICWVRLKIENTKMMYNIRKNISTYEVKLFRVGCFLGSCVMNEWPSVAPYTYIYFLKCLIGW